MCKNDHERETAPSTCSNGMPGVADGSVCCKEECGQCGGDGCGVNNGASDCCPGTIIEEANGATCDEIGAAPCVMDGFTPAPVNPANEGTAAPVGETFFFNFFCLLDTRNKQNPLFVSVFLFFL